LLASGLGQGRLFWEGSKKLAPKDIDYEEFMELAAASAPSVGYCNSLDTAVTVNILSEALGLQLPSFAAIPVPYGERSQAAYQTGVRIVDVVREELKPADVITRDPLENAYCCVFGALVVQQTPRFNWTQSPLTSASNYQTTTGKIFGHRIPLLVNVQPAGEYLAEDFFKAGGLPAVMSELPRAELLPHPNARVINGKTVAENNQTSKILNPLVIRPVDDPLVRDAGFINMKGDLFRSALTKTSVISAEVRARYLSNPDDPDAFTGRAVVFDGGAEENTGGRRRICIPCRPDPNGKSSTGFM
jgi:dihydroxy-acid dehydratase